MKSKYICRECGNDLPGLSISAKNSNIGTVEELIHHFDPCDCYEGEDDLSFKVGYLEQENAKLKAKLMNIEEGLKRLDDKMAYGDYAIHSETGDHVCLYNGFLERSELSAPTLSGLIDKILTGGE